MPLNNEILSNPHADRVRKIAGLESKSQRERSGRFLIEGPQSVREAIRWRPDAVTEANRRDAYQAVSPEVEAGLFLVPKVIE